MTSDLQKQIYELINKSSDPLIVIPPNYGVTEVSAALAIFLLLKKIGKNPQAACSVPPEGKFLFLNQYGTIASKISGEMIYKISVNVGQNNLETLSYDQLDDRLNIYLSVKKGKINVDSVKLDSTKFKYDLIVTLAAPSLDSLGKIYVENKDLFSSVPIINIDNHSFNERYGRVNVVESHSSYLSEFLSEIAKVFFPGKLDRDLATLIFICLTAETNNFQSSDIGAKAFARAAHLLDSGINRADVIKNLYAPHPHAAEPEKKTTEPEKKTNEIKSDANIKSPNSTLKKN